MCGVGALCWCRRQAEQGVWVVLTGRWGCLRGVELLGAGLAAVAVNAVALIWELAGIDRAKAAWVGKCRVRA